MSDTVVAIITVLTSASYLIGIGISAGILRVRFHCRTAWEHPSVVFGAALWPILIPASLIAVAYHLSTRVANKVGLAK